MPYRTLLAFVVEPSKDYHPICEVGAFVYSLTPTVPAKVLLKRNVEKAYDDIREDRAWGFGPEGKVHAEDSVRVDADEKPGDVPYGKVQRYVFWYDKVGNIKACDDRGNPRDSTKYDEAWFKKEMDGRRK